MADPRWQLPLHRTGDGGSPGACQGIPDAPFSRRWARQCRTCFLPCKKLPCCIFPIDKLDRYVEQVNSCSWSPSLELVGERFIGGVLGESAHHVGIGSIGQLFSLLIKPLDVVPEAFSTLLGALFEVPRASWVLVGWHRSFR